MDEVPKDKRDIGKWLRSRRESVRPKMSQSKLARLLNIGDFYIGSIERGTAVPGDPLLKAWCVAVGCPEYYVKLKAVKYPDHYGDFAIKPAELVLQAQKEELLPKYLCQETIQVLNELTQGEDAVLTTQELEKHHKKLMQQQPNIRLAQAIMEMPVEQIPDIEAYIKKMKVKTSKH